MNEVEKVFIASDHGGFKYKEKLKVWLLENNTQVEDLGSFRLDPEDDYPDFIIPLAKKVVNDSKSRGIILGRSGNGEAIAANKVRGARAAVCLNKKMAEKAREDNDANVISLGADFITFDQAKVIVKTFLETPFSGAERHKRRLEKISKAETSVI